MDLDQLKTMETVNLSWNSFSDATAAAFRHLGSSRDFADVTLASEDGEMVQAHRAVLSSSSPVLKKILLQIPSQLIHPFLFLNGISKKDIDLALEFIYFGQVAVEKDDLENFLDMANELKIAGLTLADIEDNNDEENIVKLESGSKNIEEKGQNHFCPECKKEISTKANLRTHMLAVHRKMDAFCTFCDYKSESVVNLKRHIQRQHATSKPKLTSEGNLIPDKENVALGRKESLDDPEFEMIAFPLESEQSVESTEMKKVEPWNTFEDSQAVSCTVCKKTFHNKCNLKKHYLALHENVKHSCQLCSFQTGFAANLKNHMKNKHSQ